MRKLAILSWLLVLSSCIFSQETTFKTNGPDDYCEGKHAFTDATIFVSYNKKMYSALLTKMGINTL